MKTTSFTRRSLIGGLAVTAMALLPALTGTAQAKHDDDHHDNGKHLGWDKGKHKGWDKHEQREERDDRDDRRNRDQMRSGTRYRTDYRPRYYPVRRPATRYYPTRNSWPTSGSTGRLIKIGYSSSKADAVRALENARREGYQANMRWDYQRHKWAVRIYR